MTPALVVIEHLSSWASRQLVYTLTLAASRVKRLSWGTMRLLSITLTFAGIVVEYLAPWALHNVRTDTATVFPVENPRRSALLEWITTPTLASVWI